MNNSRLITYHYWYLVVMACAQVVVYKDPNYRGCAEFNVLTQRLLEDITAHDAVNIDVHVSIRPREYTVGEITNGMAAITVTGDGLVCDGIDVTFHLEASCISATTCLLDKLIKDKPPGEYSSQHILQVVGKIFKESPTAHAPDERFIVDASQIIAEDTMVPYADCLAIINIGSELNLKFPNFFAGRTNLHGPRLWMSPTAAQLQV